MPRIRSIKPEFPQSESIGKLTRDARLLFIQLWTIVDDEGRTRAAPRMLASLLYPYDDDAPVLVGGWLDELQEHGFIRRYVACGSSYLEVVNWLVHQRIAHPTPSKIPPSPDFVKSHESSRNFTTDQDQDMDREEDRNRSSSSAGEREPDDPDPGSSAIGAKSLEAECRELVGQEPVLLDMDFTPIEGLLDQGITRADVLGGIRAALTKSRPSHRYRSWYKFENWIRNTAKDRLAAQQATVIAIPLDRNASPRGSPPRRRADEPNNPMLRAALRRLSS